MLLLVDQTINIVILSKILPIISIIYLILIYLTIDKIIVEIN